jgi:hypothetical protein
MRRIFIKKICPVYDGKCLSSKAIHSWVGKFSHGRSKVADDARQDCSIEIATEATVQLVEKLICITIDSVATALGCSSDSAYSIMHDHSESVRTVGAQRTEG